MSARDMVLIGSLEKWPVIARIVEGIFNRKQLYVQVPTATKVAAIKGFGPVGRIRAVDFDGKRYLEQNPRTTSAYATRARKGVQIVWVIDQASGEYLGRIESGRVYRNLRTVDSRPKSMIVG